MGGGRGGAGAVSHDSSAVCLGCPGFSHGLPQARRSGARGPGWWSSPLQGLLGKPPRSAPSLDGLSCNMVTAHRRILGEVCAGMCACMFLLCERCVCPCEHTCVYMYVCIV